MARILANDGISPAGLKMLLDAGHIVQTEKIPQEKLIEELNAFDGIIVRSATKVTAEIIDASPNCRFIGRAGVGMDNIDVKYARQIGRNVANTPAASSLSVAELVFAHIYSLSRFLQQSHMDMPNNGVLEFKNLKNKYSEGRELKGKTLGVIGAGRIGIETIKLAIGNGMDVLVYDLNPRTISFDFEFPTSMQLPSVNISIQTVSFEEVLKNSDFITLHVPSTGSYLIGKNEFDQMKTGAGIINCARGGVVDETALLDALDSGKLSYAGVDVFEQEPTKNEKLLKHSKVSSTPHIGGSTVEAQDRIGTEMSQYIIDFFA